MKRAKHLESLTMSSSRLSLVQALVFIFLLYFLLMSLEIPLVSQSRSQDPMPMDSLSFYNHDRHLIENKVFSQPPSLESFKPKEILSSLMFNETIFDIDSSALRNAAKEAWAAGNRLWSELIAPHSHSSPTRNSSTLSPPCPESLSVTDSEFRSSNRLVEMPCGMKIGTSVTVVGNPRWAHNEKQPMISTLKEGETAVIVSQFFIELQGIKTVEGEDPPRIFHFNPRLKGDWSGKPAIEQNTCYRMQWGHAFRCEGWKSSMDEETVDGQAKCEQWIRDDATEDNFNTMWWLRRLVRRQKKATYTWPFPFKEGKLFILSVTAGLEGFHVSVDGRHVSSFPYRTGYTLADATGMTLNGDVDVHSVFATNLPSTHPSFFPQQHLRYRREFQAPPYPGGNPELFIGILSSGNHFAERMAVRKTWMKHDLIKSSVVLARFFVALTPRREINAEIKKEAEFFGDTVIVPYVDHYDLVVFKTLAICEYSVRHVSADYVMKCDDDTFVRVEAVLNEARRFSKDSSFYMGNVNYNHTPLRSGKWGVTYEEWRKEEYPPYADGAGYVVSRDIVEHVAGRRKGVFKMEDVSMGMWVEERNRSGSVQYAHSGMFCQNGCVEGYYTAHYQSPRQMLCLWENVLRGTALCCNGR